MKRKLFVTTLLLTLLSSSTYAFSESAYHLEYTSRDEEGNKICTYTRTDKQGEQHSKILKKSAKSTCYKFI